MKRHILAFGASNSKNSINKKLATFAANQMDNAEVEILDLNDYEMPIYSIDREKENGIPELAKMFKDKIKSADGIIISFAEHNGAYTVAFKNIMDWVSRMEGSIWENKPMLLLSTSPGGRGGKSVLNIASTSFKFMNKAEQFSFSLPSFHQNFSDEQGILEPELRKDFNENLKKFGAIITAPVTI